jgi:hypothetical protein
MDQDAIALASRVSELVLSVATFADLVSAARVTGTLPTS